MKTNEITISGNGYEVTAYETTMGDWCVYGIVGDVEIDNVWAGVELATFEDADDMILGVICDEIA